MDVVDIDAARRLRTVFRGLLPWIRDEVFDLRSKQAFKDNVARTVWLRIAELRSCYRRRGAPPKAWNWRTCCCEESPALNCDGVRRKHRGSTALFRATVRALVVCYSFQQHPLRKAIAISGTNCAFSGVVIHLRALADARIEETEKKILAKRFLIRRVTKMRIDGEEYTKNLYRREWRRGGLNVHDEPITVTDPRQRLVVALVQRKVGALLGHERFNSSFQIGMLASFESFLETTRLKRVDTDTANFDDSEQAKDFLEKEGIDVADVNRLSRSYRRTFGKEMPHPKMDAVVDALSHSWTLGRKALIFVRRVASVKELKRKLDERYDQWLVDRLLRELPEEVLRDSGGLLTNFGAKSSNRI